MTTTSLKDSSLSVYGVLEYVSRPQRYSTLIVLSNKLKCDIFAKLCDRCSVAALTVYECPRLLAKGVYPSFKTL